jgi:hypothetical protein
MTRSTALIGALAAVLATTAAVAQTTPAQDAPGGEAPGGVAPAPGADVEAGAEGGTGLPVFVPRAASGEAADVEGAWLWGDTAVLRGLDKVTATTRDFEAPVGEDVSFFALTINVKRCAKRPPEMQPETIVGMEVFDRQTDGAGNEIGSKRIFSGWMFGSSPGLNPLEHPVYDVWVVDCLVPDNDETPADGTDAAPADGEGPAD